MKPSEISLFRAAAIALCLGGAQTTHAQMVSNVEVQKGNFATTVGGSITGNTYMDYRLGAKAGQKMSVDLAVTGTDGHGSAYFNILPPGSDGVAIYVGSIYGNHATIDLPEDGAYTIRVYLMGNDRDSAKTVSYDIDLAIR